MVERLRNQEKKLDQDVADIRQEWYDHMKARHSGRRATSCHTCINFDYSLRATEFQLTRIRTELQKFK